MDAAGDAEFSDFMHGRWAQLVRLGYGLTGDLQIAEDLAQTAFARAYASWVSSCPGSCHMWASQDRSRRGTT
jgi:DNA-directed RNA polymerase specialized sigma24 family protein